MSENQVQNFGDFVQSLNDELHTVDQKYSDDGENANCAKCWEKLNIYARYTTNLINNGRYYSRDISENESIPSRSLCSDGNTNIQANMNAVRSCLHNRIQMEDQAIDSLLQGKHKKNSVKIACKMAYI